MRRSRCGLFASQRDPPGRVSRFVIAVLRGSSISARSNRRLIKDLPTSLGRRAAVLSFALSSLQNRGSLLSVRRERCRRRRVSSFRDRCILRLFQPEF